MSSFDLEPGAYLQPGSPVADLADLTEIEIEVGVGDSQILGLRGGDPVQVVVDVLPGERFEGRIHEPGRVAEAVTTGFSSIVSRYFPGLRFSILSVSRTDSSCGGNG